MKHYTHFVILHSDEQLSSDTGKVSTSDEYIEVSGNNPNFNEIDANVSAAMDAKYGAGKWRRVYFLGVVSDNTYQDKINNIYVLNEPKWVRVREMSVLIEEIKSSNYPNKEEMVQLATASRDLIGFGL